MLRRFAGPQPGINRREGKPKLPFLLSFSLFRVRLFTAARDTATFLSK